MRRLPPWIWLVMALVFGTTATFMALGWLRGQSQQRTQAQETMKMRPVVVAAKDVDPAGALAQDQVVVRHWPQENCPQGSFARVEDVTGRVAAYPFGAGEPIPEIKLAPKGVSPGLTALLEPGKVAMTVKVDEASGVAGFVNPNNRVDVMVTIDKVGEYKEDPISRLVLQNLRVLGTGQQIERRPGEKPQVVPTVTLEVSPDQGERAGQRRQGRDHFPDAAQPHEPKYHRHLGGAHHRYGGGYEFGSTRRGHQGPPEKDRRSRTAQIKTRLCQFLKGAGLLAKDDC